MANLIDWLAGRKCMQYKEAQGINLAIQTIKEFPGRTFRCRETTPKTSGICNEEILKLIRKEFRKPK